MFKTRMRRVVGHELQQPCMDTHDLHPHAIARSHRRTHQGMRTAPASTVAATVRRSSATMSRHTVLRSTCHRQDEG